MSAPKDDLEAVRTLIEAVKDFKSDEQQRIFRWAAEKLGLPEPFSSSTQPRTGPAEKGLLPSQHQSSVAASHQPSASDGRDIRSFITDKKPRSDVQFAAAVAYYYRFEAPQAERKDAINKDDLQEAARKVNRDRFADPGKTLHNAHQLGMLDRASERGAYTINSVGENLVAMTLPGDGATSPKPKKAGNKGKKALNGRTKKPAKRA